ncbi:ABC transporter permease [Curtobacterium sp. RRHDQ10]|uniref:ABC transporter permease n=1 Tax=Curtobacterium phyllosphaerae TaxID=3413379 RepID=UPI003BF20460
MVSFIARRILVSVLILIAASFIMYNLAAIAGNPLQDLQGSNSPNREALIAARVASQHLDLIPPLRWGIWIGGVGKCVIGQCDLGTTFHNQAVIDLLPQAVGSTLQLVTFSFVLAIVFGIGLGIVTALRVYSGFDYAITLVSFFLYSLPSFLMAVLLKSFVALDYNNFLAKPDIGIVTLIVISIVMGAIVQLIVGGEPRKRLITFVASAVITGGMLSLMEATNWFNNPSLGPVFVILFAAGLGLAMVTMLAGTKNKRAWLVGGINVFIAIVAYFALQGLLNVSSGATIFILAVITVLVGLASGFFVGGHDRGLMMRIGALTAFLSAGVVALDRFMRSWSNYSHNFVGNRPIATVGSSTPGLQADFWITGLDTYTHLLLPSISLLLISFASYTRYSRSGMLEVLDQDYVRTARAKGLPERTVIVRHALRNMLIPIATLVATDIGALLGGAIITETVFAISGMGALFNSGLSITDVNPVMGYFLVIAITAIVFNFLADLAYSALDPRVRVR